MVARAGLLKKHKLLNKLYRHKFLYLMILPAFVLTAVFSYSPLFGWIIAFKRYRPGQSILGAPSAGFAHFRTFLLDSKDFVHVFQNTLGINLISLVVNICSAFLLALLLKEVYHRFFRRFVQTVVFIPFFISWVIAYSIVYALFSTNSGVLNQFLVNNGIIEKSIEVLGSRKYAWQLMVSLSAWKNIGYNSIIFIAAIAGIEAEQYEAATIDGAGRFGRVWFITIPNLVPTLVVLLVLNSGWLLNSNFDQFYLFTNATNWERMEVFDIYIYKFGLQLLNYSYATAVGIMRTVASLFMLLVVNALSKRLSGKSVL